MAEDPKRVRETLADEELADAADGGGDAPAAAPMADREAVARGDDTLFGGEQPGDEEVDEDERTDGSADDAEGSADG